MFRLLVCSGFACLMLASSSAPAHAQKRQVVVTSKWSGSVDDEKAPQPECITTAKGLEAVWKTWKAAGDVPRVDFSKFLVIGVYSPGSVLNLAGVNLDEQGNLEVLGFGTRDLRPGFRYVLGVVSNDGVKTVNKKALPAQ